MRISEVVKPISYLKSHAAEIIRDFGTQEKTLIITQNGEAKAILLDIKTYESMQESLLLLKILALSTDSLQKGRTESLETAFKDIRKKIKKIKDQE